MKYICDCVEVKGAQAGDHNTVGCMLKSVSLCGANTVNVRTRPSAATSYHPSVSLLQSHTLLI